MTEETKVLKHFRFAGGSTRIIFPDGTVANFCEGEYSTAKESQIQYFEDENKVYPGMFTEIQESELKRNVIPVGIDFMTELKDKMRKELLAEMASAKVSPSDIKSTIANSSSVKAASV